MSLIEFEIERQSNPVDMIEIVAASNDWSFERSGEDEIAMTVAGHWADYHVSFSGWKISRHCIWPAPSTSRCPISASTKSFACCLRSTAVLMGHFDLWRQEDVVIFRQSLLLAGGAEPNNQQVEVLLSSALEACEQYYQAFQFVVWSGLDAKSAIEAVMFETVGEA